MHRSQILAMDQSSYIQQWYMAAVVSRSPALHMGEKSVACLVSVQDPSHASTTPHYVSLIQWIQLRDKIRLRSTAVIMHVLFVAFVCLPVVFVCVCFALHFEIIQWIVDEKVYRFCSCEAKSMIISWLDVNWLVFLNPECKMELIQSCKFIKL